MTTGRLSRAGPLIMHRSMPLSDREVLVFVQQPLRLLERIAAERVAQLLRHHQLQDGGLVAGDRLLQRISYFARMTDRYAFRAHRLGDAGEAGVLEVGADIPVCIEEIGRASCRERV